MIPETEVMARLERLERDNRRLKRLGVAALVLAAALGAIFATRPVPGKITAHEFDVVDNSGKVRIRMHMSRKFRSDDATIGLLDGQGTKRVSLEVTEPGIGVVSLLGSQGFAGVSIVGPPSSREKELFSRVFPKHPLPLAGIYLSGLRGPQDLGKPGIPPLGAPRVALTVSSEGSPMISLADANGRAVTAVNANGDPMIGLRGATASIALLDTKSVERASFTLLPGGPDVTLNGETGTTGLDLDDVADKPVIRLSDPQGFDMDLGSTNTVTPATGETRQTSAASITMFGNDKSHHVIWKAP